MTLPWTEASGCSHHLYFATTNEPTPATRMARTRIPVHTPARRWSSVLLHDGIGGPFPGVLGDSQKVEQGSELVAARTASRPWFLWPSFSLSPAEPFP